MTPLSYAKMLRPKWRAPELAHLSPLTPSMPGMLVLDTTLLLRTTLPSLLDLPGFDWDDRRVMQRVLTLIQREQEAQVDLSDGCFDIVLHALGTPLESQAEQVANTLVRIGEELYRQLRAIRAYQRGFLHYQFYDWVGYDAALVRFAIDVDPNH